MIAVYRVADGRGQFAMKQGAEAIRALLPDELPDLKRQPRLASIE